RAGSGVPLVFLHPLLANRSFWERQVPMRRHCQVVRIDLRGHGDSSKPKGSYGITTLAEDLRHVIASFDLRRVILVGSSTGALVAQQALP
ncbi:MAG: alpha/beta fold hydrolase, partial [Planctomycetota bacterium]